METQLFLLILTAATFAGHVHSQRIYASENPIAVGRNLTIYSNTSVQVGGWLFNGEIIVLIYPGGYVPDNLWKSRLIYNTTTSSLGITSTRLQDSGLYQLQQMNGFIVQLDLSVQELISNVTLSAKSTNLVEFKDSAVLTCSTSTGTSLTFWWLEGNSTLSGGGSVQLSNGNTTLTIMNVTRLNQGPLRCNVSNGLGYEVSPPLQLNISYGPDNTKIAAMPMKYIYASGSDITLSCSADSNPPAMIHWMVNNVYLNQSGPQLNLSNITANQSGSYQCVCNNAVTLRQSNASMVIQILDPITAVVARQIGVPAILNQSFTLSCEVSGPVDTIQWWKNGVLMSASNTTVFGTGNKNVTLSLVQHSDGGNYQCQAFNAVSNMTSSPYAVVINYGPQMPIIMGPNVVKSGNNVTLTCQAESVPPSYYKWYFNGSLVSTSSANFTHQLTKEMSGAYVCMAFNNITGKNSTASLMLNVIDPVQNVQILGAMSAAVEGFPYTLTCDVTGSADYIHWVKNGEPLMADNRTVFNMGNKTVVFTSVALSDAGEYQCVATDVFANVTSSSYVLLVNFGPTTPIIHGPSYAETGSSVAFNCSAMSIPPSSYCWFFNGSIVSNTSEFITNPLSFNMSGEYTCMAFNNVTGEKSNNSITLTVIEAIKSVMISSNANPVNQQNFMLTCQVLGPYDSIYWLKNNTLLNASSPTYHFQKNTLQFTALSIQSQGPYQCVATNMAARHTSPQYALLVNYGPLNVFISGPDSTKPGVSVSLTCSAASQPACNFYWFFNNLSTPLGNGPVFRFTASKKNEGTYICQAKNSVTNITLTQSKTFAVAGASAAHFTTKGGLMFMGLCALTAHVLLP